MRLDVLLLQGGWGVYSASVPERMMGLMYIGPRAGASERPMPAQTHVHKCDLHALSEAAFARSTRVTCLVRNRPELLMGISCSEWRCFLSPSGQLVTKGSP